MSLKPEKEAVMLGKVMSKTSHGGMWIKVMNHISRPVHKKEKEREGEGRGGDGKGEEERKKESHMFY